MRRIGTTVIVGAIGAMGVGVAGCGGSGAALQIGALVAQSGRSTAQAKTAHLSIVSEVGGQSTTVNGTVDLTNHDGEFTSDVPGGSGTIETLLQGTTVYEKLPAASVSGLGGKPWIKIDVAKLSGQSGSKASLAAQSMSSDPTAAVSLLQGAGSDFHQVGPDTVRGVATTHYAGTVDIDKAAAAATDPTRRAALRQTATVFGVPTLPLEAWVDQQGRVRRVRETVDLSHLAAADAASGVPTGTETITTELYDFGTPFTMPALPAADQVTDYSSLTTG